MDTKDCKVGQIVQYNFRDKLEVIKVEDNTGMVSIMNLMTGDPSTIHARYLEERKEMENYLCINGKKTELTQEQLRQLGIETEEDKRAAWEIQTNLHMQLYKKLREFAFENGSLDINWKNPNQLKHTIVYHSDVKGFITSWTYSSQHCCNVYFTTKAIARRAIEEVAEPFMKEHPEFQW